jgi:3-oxoacyl-[acyl-carrier-protein] synthase III
MHIGQLLKKYVEANHRKNTEFCRMVGISSQRLQAYFRSANVRWSTIEMIASKLGMSGEQFVSALKIYGEQHGHQADQA